MKDIKPNKHIIPVFFKTQKELRKWFEKYHRIETELYVGFYKISSGKKTITWSQAVDEAICFGWIDSIRRSIDNESYYNRFTPRRPNSNWSDINIKKVEVLTKLGLMKPAGLEIFNKRKIDKSRVYSYENKPDNLSPELETIFMSNEKAWEFFNKLSNSYKKTIYFWIMSAKQDDTKLRRLIKLINECEKEKKL